MGYGRAGTETVPCRCAHSQSAERNGPAKRSLVARTRESIIARPASGGCNAGAVQDVSHQLQAYQRVLQLHELLLELG